MTFKTKLKKFFFVFLLFSIFYELYPQTKFDNKSRAKYIFDIAKQVKWPNQELIDTFKLCLLTQDTNLITVIKNTAENSKYLHNKPIKILHITNYKIIPPCEIIFFNKDENYDIDRVKINLSCKTLLITENYEFHKSMINFIVVNNVKRYELNLSKLQECGFVLNDLFIEGRVKSQADWEQLYKKTDLALQKEKEIVDQQSELIQKQKAEIDKQQQEIARQKQLILTQQQEIDQQQKEIIKQKQALAQILKQVELNKILLDEKIKELNRQEAILQSKNIEINQKSVILANQKKEIETQNKKINEQRKILNKQLEKIQMQQLILYLFIGIIILLTFLGFFIYRNYKIKKQANIALKEKNEEIYNQKIEIERQRDEIAQQKQEIMDSIRYASRIQQAVLPSIRLIQEILHDNYFIFNRPRDIVSGDYYFITSKKNKLIVSAADCTGHGVPGAFMSLLGITFLNEIVNRLNELDASNILNQLRNDIINALNQGNTDLQTKDGMDIALCVFDLENEILEFAGANNPLYIVRNKELIEYKADKMPIGVYDNLKPFTRNIIKMEKGDLYYMFSDGYADQFGGPEGKKFKYKQLKDLFVSISHLPMNEQLTVIEKTHEEWKGNYFQVDDILVIGIKFS